MRRGQDSRDDVHQLIATLEPPISVQSLIEGAAYQVP